MQKLKGIMAEQNVRQSDLAGHIGISVNSLSKKMRGIVDFRLGEVYQICDFLKIQDPANIFFNNTVPKKERTAI